MDEQTKHSIKIILMPRVCRICRIGEKNKHLKKCKRCKVLYYCSEECQKEDWRRHKKECGKFEIIKLEEKENHGFNKILVKGLDDNNYFGEYYALLNKAKF